MHESAVEHIVPKNRVRRTVYFGGDRVVDVTGPNGGKIIVYTITDLVTDELIYVGSGKVSRLLDHLTTATAKKVGHQEYAIDVIWDGDNDAMALASETLAILAYRPRMNRRLLATRGGRPVGISTSAETRLLLSRLLEGRSREWMIGNAPWNKGLTKKDDRVSQGNRSYPDRVVAGFKAWETRRANGTTGEGLPAWNRGLKNDPRLVGKRKPMTEADHEAASERTKRSWDTRRNR